MEFILVSACLLGVNCKYDGNNNLHNKILRLKDEYGVIPVCPEQLGGLTTPRLPAEIIMGDGQDILKEKARVIRCDGADVTEAFIKGAKETLKIAESMNATKAILKARSPSCGVGEIYDGSFTRALKSGDGVTTALLKSKGVQVWDENNFTQIIDNSID